MKRKIKKCRLFILSALFMVCACCGFLFNGGTLTANAAAVATPKYAIPITYSTWYKSNTSTSTTGSGTSTSFSARIGQSTTSTYSVALYGSSASGTGTWNGYINSSTVTIVLSSSSGTPTVTVTNSSGTTVGSGTKTISLTGLSNGTYTATFGDSGGWLVNGRQYDQAGFNASFSFSVDCTAPTISGASTSSTGKYTNTSFTVSATDSGGSGLSALYYKTPTSSSYSSVSVSKTFSAGGANGLYAFYAKDGANNQSATYYVYYDDQKATGVVKTASGTILSSSSAYTSESFSYTATDSGSGVNYLQCMKPNSSSWDTYTAGTLIPATSTNGKYQFRAIDKANNVSDITSVYLDSGNPVGVLYSGTTAVSSGYKSTASYIKYVASDAASGIKTVYVKKPNASSYTTYTNGTQLTENGTYSFFCEDNVLLESSVVTISLDNKAPTLTLSKGNWNDTLSDSFTVSATDNIGGTVLYYKKPNGSFVQSTSTSVSIAKTEADGTYEFYAKDGYGNTSATYSVKLSIPAPVAQVVKASDGNQICVIWTDNNVTGKLNGTSYTNGTWIKTEGNHTFVLTNDANRSTTYTFSIDHYYRQKTVVSPTCTTQGYTVYECDNCGDTYNANFVNALGHNYIVTRVVESTCTAEGYSVYTCTRCGASRNDDVVSANGHDYSSWYIVKDSTCTETGIRRRDCVSCGSYETEEIEAKGHNYEGTVTNPTCEEQGYTTYVCSRCNATYKDNFTEALGHNYVATITAPTCTERGYTTQKCSRCEDSYVEDYVNAHGHTYGVWKIASEPTCIDNGLRYKTCGTCNYRYNEAIPALGHDYGAEVVEPTCVDKGYTTHICSRCGTGYNDTFVDALGHAYEPLRIEPTCTEEGYIGQCCSRCSDTYKTQILKANGHDYVETYVEVTCTEDGCVLHICLTCGYEYKTDIVKASGHSLETKVLLASTCEGKGERYYGCTKCDYERIDEIPERGHNYEISQETNADGVITRTYVCTICAQSFEQDLGEQYEKVSNYVEYLFDEYSPYMMWVFLATAGVWSIGMGIAIIIATKNEDKAKAKKMLVNYGIGLIVIFAILVAAPYLVHGIAALIS